MAGAFVEILEPFAQTMSFDTGDGVFARVESGFGTAKDFGSDVVLAELAALVGEIFFADVAQKIDEPRRVA